MDLHADSFGAKLISAAGVVWGFLKLRTIIVTELEKRVTSLEAAEVERMRQLGECMGERAALARALAEQNGRVDVLSDWVGKLMAALKEAGVPTEEIELPGPGPHTQAVIELAQKMDAGDEA